MKPFYNKAYAFGERMDIMKRILVFLICISLVFGAAPYAFAEQDAIILTGEKLVNNGTAINAFWEIGEFDGEKCAVAWGGKTRATTGAPILQYIFKKI